MIENGAGHIFAAFEILLEEIETEIDIINGLGAKAFEKGVPRQKIIVGSL